jgi:putative membrane protein
MAGRESEKIILILLVTVVMVVVVGGFYMMTMISEYWRGYDTMAPRMMGWTGMGYRWWMPLGSLIFLVVLIAGLYLVFSASRKPEQPLSTGALEILKERYAKGELTSEQYNKMKKELEA